MCFKLAADRCRSLIKNPAGFRDYDFSTVEINAPQATAALKVGCGFKSGIMANERSNGARGNLHLFARSFGKSGDVPLRLSMPLHCSKNADIESVMSRSME